MCVLICVVCTLLQFWCIYDLEYNDMVTFLQNNENNIEIGTNDDIMLLGHFHAMFNKIHTQYGTKMED